MHGARSHEHFSPEGHVPTKNMETSSFACARRRASGFRGAHFPPRQESESQGHDLGCSGCGKIRTEDENNTTGRAPGAIGNQSVPKPGRPKPGRSGTALTTVDPPQKYETIANGIGWSQDRPRHAPPVWGRPRGTSSAGGPWDTSGQAPGPRTPILN